MALRRSWAEHLLLCRKDMHNVRFSRGRASKASPTIGCKRELGLGVQLSEPLRRGSLAALGAHELSFRSMLSSASCDGGIQP